MRRRTTVLALVLVAAGLALVAGGLVVWRGAEPPARLAAHPATALPRPTLTEPILPPRPAGSAAATSGLLAPTHPARTGPAAQGEATPLRAPEEAPTGTSAPVPPSPSPPPPSPSSPALPAGPTAPLLPALYSLRERVGIGGGSLPVTAELVGSLGFGWYLDWSVRPEDRPPAQVSYMPMIRLRDGHIAPSGDALLAAVDAMPGALWLIGNEPDVQWQDNVTPEAYAQAYHDLYALLKARDPTCQVAVGGVSQPTPLRLRYLDRILAAYRQRYGQEMPVDVWNVHNFVLREERGSWGVDIPPGMDDLTGRLYDVDDHDDLALFRQQLVEFRLWMAGRGQQDKPLIVSEYGILMPPDYGFPPEAVRQFMLATFELMATLRDPALGYPPDGGRLVQRWCWFSLQDERYPTGDLVDAAGGRLTPLGEALARYTGAQP